MRTYFHACMQATHDRNLVLRSVGIKPAVGMSASFAHKLKFNVRAQQQKRSGFKGSAVAPEPPIGRSSLLI